VIPDCVDAVLEPLARQIDAVEAAICGYRQTARGRDQGQRDRQTAHDHSRELANKVARIVYALLTKGGRYEARPTVA
jgi:hypothetical protein